MLPKLIYLLILTSGLFSSCHKTSQDNLLEVTFKSQPQGHSQQLNAEDLSLGVLEGSCEDIEGPKKFHTIFQKQHEHIKKIEHWTNEHRFLFERALVTIDAEELFLSVTQFGCTHFGNNLVLKRMKPFQFQGVDEAYVYLVNLAGQPFFTSEGKKILNSGLEILAQLQQQEQLHKKCSQFKGKISCTIYQDPRNVELFVVGGEIKFNYWYVL